MNHTNVLEKQRGGKREKERERDSARRRERETVIERVPACVREKRRDIKNGETI